MMDFQDELYNKAKQIIINEQKVSLSLIQRRLGLNYNDATYIMNQLIENQIVYKSNSFPSYILSEKYVVPHSEHNAKSTSIIEKDTISKKNSTLSIMEFIKKYIGIKKIFLFLIWSIWIVLGCISNPNQSQIISGIKLVLLALLILIFIGCRNLYIIKKRDKQKQSNLTLEQHLTRIDFLDGISFEHECANLLRLNGFKNVIVTKTSNDYGIDILAEKNQITYAIQCKHYSYPVGNASVQEAFAGKEYYKCDKAVVITNSTFTDNAAILANRTHVLLWDRSILKDLIKNGFIE